MVLSPSSGSGAPPRPAWITTRSSHSVIAVGRDVGFERELAPDRDRGVGAVHRHLMQPAPDPPVRRARSEERPHRCFHARLLHSVDQPLRAAMQPGDRVVGIRRRLATFDAAGIEELVEPLAHDLRRPPIPAADVAEQLLEAPARARRHRCGRIGIADDVPKSAGLLEVCRCVVHVGQVTAGGYPQFEVCPQAAVSRAARAVRDTLDFENMFDTLWAHATDADIVDAIGDAARAEAAAAARRLAAIAELVGRHANGSTAHAHWSCDNWDAIAAQVAAIHNISHTMASGQMYLAVALRDRLPGVAALFAQGLIDARLAGTIVWRTNLIKDPEVLRRVDATLANDAQSFGPLSATKTAEAIDDIVDRYDPAMAHHVCDNDPRTLAQRRADVLGTLGADGNQLACRCGTPNCPAALETDPRATAVLIHVIAEPATMNAKPDPHTNGEPAPRPITPQTTLREAAAPDPEIKEFGQDGLVARWTC